jgi:leucyl aminopeptidase
MHKNLVRSAAGAVPLHLVTAADAKAFLAAAGNRAGLAACGFAGRDGELLPLTAGGNVTGWVLGLGAGSDPFAAATFAEKLPDGVYRLGEVPALQGGANAALAWLLGTYAFTRYKSAKKKTPRLVLPAGVDGEETSRVAEAVFLARDLVNTPANDMGPAELAAAGRKLAAAHGAKIGVVKGASLKRGFPRTEARRGG